MTDVEHNYHHGMMNNILLQFYQTPVITLDEYNDEDVARCIMHFFTDYTGYEACLVLLNEYIAMKQACSLAIDDLCILRDRWLTFHESWKERFMTSVHELDLDVVDEAEKARECYAARCLSMEEEKWTNDHVLFNALNKDFWTNVCDQTLSWVPQDYPLSAFHTLRLFSCMFRVRMQDLASAYSRSQVLKKRKRN